MISSIDSIMYNLSILNERNEKVNYGLSTGESLQNGSDDSMKFDYILGIQNDTSMYSSIQEGINYSDTFSTASDSALAEIKTATESIIAEIIKANTDTTNQEGKESIALEIEGYKELLFSLANSQSNGEYLFSGINSDSQSFVMDDTTGQVSYQSDNSLKSVNVEENRYISQGVNGIDVFYYTNNSAEATDTFIFTSNEIIIDEDNNQWKLMDSDNDGVDDGLFLNGDISSSSMSFTTNADGSFTATNSTGNTLDIKHSIFDDLDDLTNALNLEDSSGNTITSDEASIILSDSLDKLNDAYDSQNTSHSLVGSRTNSIDTFSSIVQSKLTNLAILENEYASADLTALAVEAQALENTYTALYSTINRVNDLSLVKYLS